MIIFLDVSAGDKPLTMLRDLIRKFACFCRSPIVVSYLLVRRFHLRLKRIHFGHSLFLEGCMELLKAGESAIGKQCQTWENIFT